MAINNVDDFLNHKGNDRSGGFLSKWKAPVEKKGGGGKVVTWLHPKRLPIALWQHRMPKVVTREDRQTGEMKNSVWSGDFPCHETEDVLKARKRDENGNRLKPFKRCPVCRMIEKVRQLVDDGTLPWTTALFRFEGDEDRQVLHAGGIYNAFGRDDLSDEEKKELKAAGITKTEGWMYRENLQAKLQYVFCVVDNANVDGGVQIAIETGLLGDKVKTVIADARESLGEEVGNPFKNPYAIQWQYKPLEQEFSKKYHALRMEQVKITPGVQKLLNGPPPDVSRVIKPFDIDAVRATLERHCLVKKLPNGKPFPWDEIFDVESSGSSGESEGEAEVEEEESKPYDSASVPPATTSVADVVAEGEDDGPIPCEACGHEFAADLDTCPKCGAQYDAEGNLVKKETPPPPPTTRKRGSAAGKKLPF